MKNNRIVVGITHGDINSISYEVIIKALMDNRIMDFCTPVVYGSPKVAAYHRKALNIDNFSFNNIKTPEEANPKRANIINCISEDIRVELGKSTSVAGEASVKALEIACQDLADGKIDVLVTGPINKYNIQSEKFTFAGHTEFLETRFNSAGGLMFMVNDFFRVGVVTSHIPIAKIPEYITKDAVLNKIRIMNKSLIEDFGCRKPRIALLGLNPHAGDNGVIGDEEKREIKPAIEAAREESILAFGPYPADGFFGSANFNKFDGILAMYHDQGLIPFKALLTDEGVNFTAGLSVVRTSPAHGTAYEIAGKGEASANSFRKAIYLACDIFKRRNGYKELTENPLKSYDISEI
ncbi:MAG: 4-hydroxythreonine-4-phosphate dehydrogenase PdxA [Bacteroidales bacterium]|nr:4-hydroxythreonine-4-phosphate dehydrogenase PdxA [Bacteroidales bacterium]